MKYEVRALAAKGLATSPSSLPDHDYLINIFRDTVEAFLPNT
jgi:hypothetical protein